MMHAPKLSLECAEKLMPLFIGSFLVDDKKEIVGKPLTLMCDKGDGACMILQIIVYRFMVRGRMNLAQQYSSSEWSSLWSICTGSICVAVKCPVLEESMLLAHLCFIVGYSKSWWTKHFDWQKYVDTRSGTAGFLGRHMAIRYYLQWDDLQNLMDFFVNHVVVERWVKDSNECTYTGKDDHFASMVGMCRSSTVFEYKEAA